jgi:predicted RNase H-like nuclease
MKLTGVDGCKAGWLAITRNLERESFFTAVHFGFDQLAAEANDSAIIAVDIPIGLTTAGPRSCDRLARRLLGKRHSTIFPAPIRPALTASSRKQASEITRGIDGRGVGAQAWNIYKKVREVDRFLRCSPDWQEIVYEVHPEVSFMSWNKGAAILEPKKSAEGMRIRKALVRHRYGEGVFEDIREKYPRNLVADDDIADALAALWTAERIHSEQAVLIPDPPEVDLCGLRMAITH